MRRILRDRKGYTLIEILFVAVISVVAIGAIVSAWVFMYAMWTSESEHTLLRVDIMKALETIKTDLRLSSLTYVSFYPAGGEPYTAVSLPVAEVDANGLFTMDAVGEIDWDKTVIYHLYTDGGGTTTLRRTVFDPRDNDMDETERYEQLESVVTSGTGGAGSTTDTEFLEDVDTFEISSMSPVIDFYDSSSTPVKIGKVVFGSVKLDAASHTIRFEITGKNDSSSGYNIGLDNIMIEPSGSIRDAEYYNSSFAHAGALTVSGGTVARVHDPIWSNDNYLEFRASGEGDYIEIADYYDLLRESAFENAVLNNAEKVEDEVRVGLDIPEEAEEGEITWFAYAETGDSAQAGNDGDLPAYPVTLRTVVTNAQIDMEGDIVRVRLKSSSENPLKVEAVYITRRNADEDGLPNQAPGGLAISEYHLHQQLFFKDVHDMDGDGDSTDKVEFVYVAPDSEVWSEWTAFPLVLKDSADNDVDYVVTLYIPDLESVTWPAGWSGFDPLKTDCRYWIGSSGTDRTYYVHSSACAADHTTDTFTAAAHGLSDDDRVAIGGSPVPAGISDWLNLADLAGTPDWQFYYVVGATANTFQVSASSGGSAVDFSDNGTDVTFGKLTPSADIYITGNIDIWGTTGTVESQIYDTTLGVPVYNQAEWSENRPAGTSILLKARSCANEYMTGATTWDLIAGSGANPHALGIGSGRYVQFLAELSAEPFWETSISTLGYADYITAQTADPGKPYDFPVDSAGDPHVTGVSSPWIDDVEIDWPGAERICTLTGNIAKKNDYGQAKIIVDGVELMKILSVHIKLSKEIQGRTVEVENFVEVQPRNTGK